MDKTPLLGVFSSGATLAHKALSNSDERHPEIITVPEVEKGDVRTEGVAPQLKFEIRKQPL